MENRSIVVLGYGPQEMNFLSKAIKLTGKDAILEPDVARMAGANFCIGNAAGVEELRKRVISGAIHESMIEHGRTGKLSMNAVIWLATGERGMSSETLFTFITGVDAEGDHGHNYPHDPDDVRRCRLLLEQCPELASCLPRVAAAGPEWEALAARWDEICALMDEETPEWRKGHGRASKTYELMKEIIKGAQSAQRKEEA